MKRLIIPTMLALVLGLLIGAPFVGAQGGWFFGQGVRFDVSSQTCASNGGGTAAALTVTVLKTYVALTQSDPDGCALTVSETGARDGALLTIANISSNTATIADSAGVQETNAGVTITLAQYDTATFLYRSDRWVEVSRSQPQVGTTNTATLTNKTLTAPVLTTGVQIAAIVATLTDAQIKALPTTPITLIAAPGSGKAIVPIHAVLYTKTSAGAYTNINAAGVLQVRFDSTHQGLSYVPNDVAITNGSATLLTDLLGTTTNTRAVLLPEVSTENVDDWGPVPIVNASAGFTNAALVIDIDNSGSGVLTGGNAANSLTVFILYSVVTVP